MPMPNGNVPVVMLPLGQAHDMGLVERQPEEEVFRMSHSTKIPFHYMNYLHFREDLHCEENNWIEAVIGGQHLIRVYKSPLKKYRGCRVGAEIFHDILTRHAVIPVAIGERLFLYAWDYLTTVFGLAKVINYLYDLHGINYYYDRGYPRNPIEITKKEPELPENTEQTLSSLLDGGSQNVSEGVQETMETR